MPTYPYICPLCDHEFDVTKSIARIEDDEHCSLCRGKAHRHIARVNFSNAGDWNPSFNHAFGCVVKSKKHQREIIDRYRDKGRDFEEVGNEPVENIHKYYDNKREEMQKERWSESAAKILQEETLA